MKTPAAAMPNMARRAAVKDIDTVALAVDLERVWRDWKEEMQHPLAVDIYDALKASQAPRGALLAKLAPVLFAFLRSSPEGEIKWLQLKEAISTVHARIVQTDQASVWAPAQPPVGDDVMAGRWAQTAMVMLCHIRQLKTVEKFDCVVRGLGGQARGDMTRIRDILVQSTSGPAEAGTGQTAAAPLKPTTLSQESPLAPRKRDREKEVGRSSRVLLVISMHAFIESSSWMFSAQWHFFLHMSIQDGKGTLSTVITQPTTPQHIDHSSGSGHVSMPEQAESEHSTIPAPLDEEALPADAGTVSRPESTQTPKRLRTGGSPAGGLRLRAKRPPVMWISDTPRTGTQDVVDLCTPARGILPTRSGSMGGSSMVPDTNAMEHGKNSRKKPAAASKMGTKKPAAAAALGGTLKKPSANMKKPASQTPWTVVKVKQTCATKKSYLQAVFPCGSSKLIIGCERANHGQVIRDMLTFTESLMKGVTDERTWENSRTVLRDRRACLQASR